MAHFSAKPLVRVRRINVYDSLAILGFTSELHSYSEPLRRNENV